MWLPSQAAEGLGLQAGDHCALPFSATLQSPEASLWQMLPSGCWAV